MPNFCLRCSIGRCYFPQRWIMVIICLVGVIVCYGQKFSLKMALDFYMKNRTSRKTSRLQVYSARSQLQLFNGSIHDAALKPQWSHKQETLIVSSFFIGYSLFNVPAGLMSDRISPKYLLGLGILTSSIGTMMVPVSVQYIAWWVTLLIRISMGIGQSSLLPAISTLIARWIPKGEQTFAMSFIVSGNLLGITLSFLLTNKIVICTGSWTTGFYFWGLLGVAWYLFCLTYIRSSPENHNYICKKELDFLNENMRVTIPHRYVLSILMTISLFIAFGQRQCLTISVKVVHNSSFQLEEAIMINTSLNLKRIQAFKEWGKFREFMPIAPFNVGYIFTHLPSGILSDRLGGKYVMGIGILVSAIITMCTPIALEYSNWSLTIALLFVMGMGQATMYPAMSSLISRWIPNHEKNTMTSFIKGAISFEIVISQAVTLFLIECAGNTSISFYFWGLCGVIWYAIFLLYGYSGPEEHPFITRRELKYIQYSVPKHFPQRWMIATLCLMSIIVAYGQRVSLNIAITKMVKHKPSISCPVVNRTTPPTNVTGPKKSWSEEQQNSILGAFYIGYFVMHVPAGFLSDKFGGRYVLSFGMMLSTLVTVCTPISVTHAHWLITYLLRVIMGFGQAVLYPAISSLYGRWVPKSERSTIGGFSFAANALGVIVGTLLTGMLIYAVKDWQTPFYLWGGIGLTWLILCIVYVYSGPETHPHVTEGELAFLHETIGTRATNIKIPWLKFFTDMGVLAMFIAEIGHDFTIYTLITNMPKYMSDVLNYDIQENAVASSFPYVCQWLSGVAGGKIVDYMIHKKGYDILLMRKLVTTVGLTLPSLFVLFAGYMNCRRNLVVVMFSLNLFAKGFLYCGLKVNHLDMSLNFPGILMAFTNGIGALSGFVSPYIIAMVATENTLEQWHIVYWIVFCVALVTNIVYLIFARAHRAKWDYGPDEADLLQKDMDQMKAEQAARQEAKRKKKEEK